ncbi:MarR family winged helix-turn-helix transcriptional regulator [uncultured Tateyamaria sp.]|uniref:MarR family winged helix-turn-helix transcriptional regulator n=1 Tax=uncultured Tateyamaria sp. TaxID=455651 RepID=UPI0026295A5C|nr:MarR family winged helix-turn-helix transcriptional regulator [uncultured Tateyamaria sp.]
MSTTPPDKPPLKLSGFLTFRLSRLQAQINSQAQYILSTHSDIGQTEWRVMILVADVGQSTMAAVVREGQIDKAQVSRAVKSLIRKEYMDSHVDPSDHRQSILALTASGRALYDRVLPMMRERQKVLMADLSEDEVATVFSVLDRLEAAAQRRDF